MLFKNHLYIFCIHSIAACRMHAWIQRYRLSGACLDPALSAIVKHKRDRYSHKFQTMLVVIVVPKEMATLSVITVQVVVGKTIESFQTPALLIGHAFVIIRYISIFYEVMVCEMYCAKKRISQNE